MLKFNSVLSVLVVCLFYINGKGYAHFIEDYCWRDYEGVVPPDALKAGKARDGSPIYVGQTLYDGKLIPGKIHENANEIHIEFHTAHNLTENIKILCTEYPEMFEWVKTHYDKVLDLANVHLFEGGFEKGYLTYVGRQVSHGELTVGKVVCFDRDFDRGCYKLTTIEDGKWYDHSEFEILTYNPDVEVTVKATTERSGDGDHASMSHHEKPGFWSYFLLVLIISVLIVLVVLAVRRC